MSDYLTNLVAKARNVANAVQPRPASPFEPSAAGGTPINGGGADAEFAPEERLSGETAVDRPLIGSTPFDASAYARPPRIDVGPPSGAAPPRQSSIVNADARQHPVAMTGSSSTEPVANPFIVKQAAVVQRPLTIGDARKHSQPAGNSESVFTPRTEPARPATVISRERVVSLLAAPHDRFSPSSTPAEAPTIKISIGRVDVRAIMPASPAPPRASGRRASLSLDEYLKRQGERKR